MLPPTRTVYFEDLSLGMTETYAKVVSSNDVVGFAEISGDRNPIHLSEHFAAHTPFGGRIAHGLYTASLISAVIGTRLPGPGAIYLSQTLNFRAPVKIGDTVVASVQVAPSGELQTSRGGALKESNHPPSSQSLSPWTSSPPESRACHPAIWVTLTQSTRRSSPRDESRSMPKIMTDRRMSISSPLGNLSSSRPRHLRDPRIVGRRAMADQKRDLVGRRRSPG